MREGSRVVGDVRQQQREACRRWAYAAASVVAETDALTSPGLQLGSREDSL